MDPKTLENLQIPLKLPVSQVNLVLKALGTLPYAEVADCVASIKNQGDPVVQLALHGPPIYAPASDEQPDGVENLGDARRAGKGRR